MSPDSDKGNLPKSHVESDKGKESKSDEFDDDESIDDFIQKHLNEAKGNTSSSNSAEKTKQ